MLALQALIVSLFLCGLLILGARRGWRWIPVDHPNHRSLHTAPVPRCGGIAIWLTVASLLFPIPNSMHLLGIALLALAVVSYFDDLLNLSAASRLVVHLAVAGVVAGSLGESFVAVAAIGMLLATAANLTNFMDGANGLVGGVLLTIACMLAGFIYLQGGNSSTYWLEFVHVLAGALAGFLVLNWGRGHLFLGDTGSVPLGFLLVALALIGIQNGFWVGWLPLFAFSPLYADALFTLACRAWRRQPIWQAHREHAYQRLVQSGRTHQEVASLYIVLTLIASVLGYIAELRALGAAVAIFSAFCILLLALYSVALRSLPSTTPS